MNAKKKSNKKKWIIFGVIAVLVIGAIVAYATRPASLNYESVKAKTGNITTYYSFSGNVDTKHRQTVVSDKIMQVSELNVEDGDTVESGDILIKTTTGEEVKAKIDGKVVNLEIEEDEQLMAGVQLMEIVDYNNLEVSVKVDEYDISALKTGKRATVEIGAIDKKIKGEIVSMSDEGQVVNGVTYFTATIDLAKDKKIKIGMTADVTLLNKKVKDVVTLPMTAIQFDDNNNPYVFIKDKNNEAVKTEITTGINDGTLVEIRKGISNGQTILYTKADTSANLAFGRRPATSDTTTDTGSNGNAGGSSTNG